MHGNAAPYLLGFSLICGILSYGMMKRTAWMWYTGWAVLYLFSSYLGSLFLANLQQARNPAGEVFAFSLFIIGFLLWLPLVLFWIRYRGKFRKKR